MENGLSLKDYLSKKYPFLSELLTQSYIFENCFEYDQFLNKTIIVEESNKSVDSSLPYLSNANTFLELIDSLVVYLLSKKSTNILINGYLDPSSNAAWSSTIMNPYVNFQVNFLKNKYWNKLYTQIGKDRFLALVLNTKCFAELGKENYLQIFGHGKSFKKTYLRVVSKSRMLYKNGETRQNSLRLLPSDSLKMLESIFPNETGKANLPKKFRRLKRLCDKVISNDIKCNYLSIYNNIVSYKQDNAAQSNFDYITNFSKVISFTLTILGKLFPLSIWGKSSNKTIIIHRVIDYVKSGVHEKVPIKTIVSAIKVTDIYWLGKTSKITSKQDFLLRTNLLYKFIDWFFSIFICKLIRSFWYVTESSHLVDVALPSGGLLYYPHSCWKSLTKQWLEDYIESYLVDVSKDVFIEDGGAEKLNYGRLRLIPKSNDFRVLCIPIKRPFSNDQSSRVKYRENQKFEYLNYINNVIRPVREILMLKAKESLQSTDLKHPRCNSTRDVANNLKIFKINILKKFNGHIPKLFMVKFDMKHCYDRLDQNKIMECIEKLFDDDGDDKDYFIRQFTESQKSNEKLKKIRTLINDPSKIADFDLLSSNVLDDFGRARVLIDKVKTVKLNKSQVIEISRSQIFDSSIIIQERSLRRTYKRKQGVFQGFPLSSTFCDIVYNSLVDENFGFLLDSNSSSLMLRLADDFLVISTEEEQCQKVYEVITGDSLHIYGAYVNTEKTTWASSDSTERYIKFVGLNINIETLDVSRELNSGGSYISLSKQYSFKGVYSYLQWCYRIRLTDYLLNLDLCPFQSMLSNIDAVLDIILVAFCRDFKKVLKREEFDKSDFKNFLLGILYETLLKYKMVNSTCRGIDKIIEEFKKSISIRLNKQNNFTDIINWLYNI